MGYTAKASRSTKRESVTRFSKDVIIGFYFDTRGLFSLFCWDKKLGYIMDTVTKVASTAFSFPVTVSPHNINSDKLGTRRVMRRHGGCGTRIVGLVTLECDNSVADIRIR